MVTSYFTYLIYSIMLSPIFPTAEIPLVCPQNQSEREPRWLSVLSF